VYSPSEHGAPSILQKIENNIKYEMAFSKLKAHLRKVGARTFTDLFAAIGDICDLFTPDQCWNFLSNAGYAPT
jgi:hypothetical protein